MTIQVPSGGDVGEIVANLEPVAQHLERQELRTCAEFVRRAAAALTASEAERERLAAEIQRLRDIDEGVVTPELKRLAGEPVPLLDVIGEKAPASVFDPNYKGKSP